jgi:hypothetical protein
MEIIVLNVVALILHTVIILKIGIVIFVVMIGNSMSCYKETRRLETMRDYWLIYVHTDRLEAPRAKRFDDPEKIRSWVDKQENIEILDCVPCSKDEEEMDCLQCTLSRENACADCCRDWDSEDDE